MKMNPATRCTDLHCRFSTSLLILLQLHDTQLKEVTQLTYIHSRRITYCTNGTLSARPNMLRSKPVPTRSSAASEAHMCHHASSLTPGPNIIVIDYIIVLCGRSTGSPQHASFTSSLGVLLLAKDSQTAPEPIPYQHHCLRAMV